MFRAKPGLVRLLIALPFVGASVIGPTAVASAATPADVPTCTPKADGDYAHISITSTTRAVQAHGWWLEGTCSEPFASVFVQMQEDVNGKYVNVGSPAYKTSLAPGGGSAARVTGHVDCKYNIQTYWRSVVTVDVGGENEGNASKTTTGQPVPGCEV
jgi:hypothetical protein